MASSATLAPTPDNLIAPDVMANLALFATKYEKPTNEQLALVQQMAIALLPENVRTSNHFQKYVQQMNKADRILTFIDMKWLFEVGPMKYPLYFALHVHVYDPSPREQRYKTNEVVVIRPDLMHVCAYYYDPDTDNYSFVLVQELRSTKPTGPVTETPGGSSFNPNKDPMTTALSELRRETGFVVDDSEAHRVVHITTKQSSPTLTPMEVHVFALSLNQNEFEQIKKNAVSKTPFGKIQDTERTYVTILTYDEVCDLRLCGLETIATCTLVKRYDERLRSVPVNKKAKI